METKEIPTHDEIRATFAEVRDQIERSHLCLDATIDDYPIGRRERGKCRLQVERAANKGYRTVRTTTNKAGRWCKPQQEHVQQQPDRRCPRLGHRASARLAVMRQPTS